MNDYLLSLLVTQTWQIAVVALLAWLLVRLFARDRPHLAHAIWVLVLLKCLTPPLIGSPTSPFSWIASQISASAPLTQTKSSRQTRWSNPLAATAARSTTGEGKSFEDFSPLPRPVDDTELAQNLSGASVNLLTAIDSNAPSAASFDRPSQESSTELQRQGSLSLSVIIVWLWAAGFAISVLITVIRLRGFLRVLSRSRRIQNNDVSALTQSLAQRLNIRRRVDVEIYDAPIGPAVFGLWRPKILLPTVAVDNIAAESLETLLAHELIHVRRGDLWWSLLQTIATSVFWFHPLVWLSSRMVTRESERSCDEETIGCLGCQSAVYARSLLNILEQKRRLYVAPALPGMRPVDITSARLERVMKLGNGCHKQTPMWIKAVTLLLAIVVLPGAAITWAQDPTEIEHSKNPAVGFTDRWDGDSMADSNVAARSSQPPPKSFRPSSGRADFKTTTDSAGLACRRSFNVWEFLTPAPEGLATEKRQKQRYVKSEEDLLQRLSTMSKFFKNPVVDPSGTWIAKDLNSFCKLKFSDGILLVDSSGLEVIDDIRQSLQAIKVYDAKQIVVELRSATLPALVLEDIDLRWMISASHFDLTIPFPISGVDTDGNPVDGAQAATTEFQPALYALPDEDQLTKLLTLPPFQEGTSTMTLFNGQKASVSTGYHSPFVVGLRKATAPKPGDTGLEQNETSEDKADASTVEPVIKMIHDGTSAVIHVDANEQNVIHLDCVTNVSKILNVRSEQVNFNQAPYNIQVPEVNSNRVSLSADLPSGKTMLLKSLYTNAKGKRVAVVTALTCRVIEPGSISESKLATPRSVDEAATSFPIAGPAEPAVEGAEFYKIVIQSEQKKSVADVNTNHAAVIAKLKKMRVDLDILGDAACTFENNRFFLSGKKIKVFDNEGELVFKGDDVSLEVLMKDGEPSEAKLVISGNAKLAFGEMTFSAEALTCIQDVDSGGLEMSIELAGNAEYLDSEKKVTANGMLMPIGGGTVVLEGNVQFTNLDGKSPKMIQADRIDWDTETDVIKATGAFASAK